MLKHDEPPIEEISKLIHEGKLSCSTGPEVYQWSEDDKNRLQDALSKIFGWKDQNVVDSACN